MKKLLTFTLWMVSQFSAAQNIALVNPILLKNNWTANWISAPNIPAKEYGVYHFRNSFELNEIPKTFLINISADNRYRLFVNGQSIGNGPARGDLYNWYYETYDIAPYLVKGKNTIAAQVWNMGVYAPVAQISNQTAFLLQGNGEVEKIVNSNKNWKVLINEAYRPCSTNNGEQLKTYMVVGPGDSVSAKKYPWGWEQKNYDDHEWTNAITISSPASVGYGTDNLWSLVPSIIPPMFEKKQSIYLLKKINGENVNSAFEKNNTSLILGKNSITNTLLNTTKSLSTGKTISLLYDQTFNTVAYPTIVVSGGKDAIIKITYAESLFDSNGVKGNRSVIEGKTIKGNYDVFIPDGSKHRTFRPLWMRTYRYVQVDITLKEDSIEIEDFYGMSTGYPFQVKAKFESNDSSLQKIWEVGWRTAQLCAGETYFDCPYYEQLQYEGDTRIQSLISLYVTGDDRLMRKAILDFYHSRVPEGLTQGRYPSSRLQVIPPFSLYWISMVYDYWMHRKDDAFVDQFMVPITGVLDWYEKHLDTKKNILGPMKWWGFVDWNLAFDGGTPDGALDGNSSIITLQYIATLQQAATLFKKFGKTDWGNHYANLANKLSSATYANCFNNKKNLMANTPLKNSYSQHASIMGVLTGAIPKSKQKIVMENVLKDTSLSQATFYYRFYLNLALKKAGMANSYYKELKPWREMIANGLTTFAEQPDPTRSDCHAWSASPNYDFFATICGITPAAPGFSSIKIEPALGELNHVKASMPHPNGNIEVEINKQKNYGVEAVINLPKNTTGTFIWGGQQIQLHGGIQKIKIG
jgi:alpha-L-rhamnosidase